jgi:FeS assembly SUF system regulator
MTKRGAPMLRLSKLSDYGTVIMAHMAREPARSYSASELAEAVSLGRPTVTKLLKLLAHEQLLVSQRGAKGGYTLARTPAEISIAQIIDAVDGRFGVTECSASAGLCTQETVCGVRANWQRINRVIRDTLASVTLGELAGPPLAFGDGQPRHMPQACVHVVTCAPPRTAVIQETAPCPVKPLISTN